MALLGQSVYWAVPLPSLQHCSTAEEGQQLPPQDSNYFSFCRPDVFVLVPGAVRTGAGIH